MWIQTKENFSNNVYESFISNINTFFTENKQIKQFIIMLIIVVLLILIIQSYKPKESIIPSYYNKYTFDADELIKLKQIFS